MADNDRTSRLPGFKDQSPADRGLRLAASAGLSEEQLRALDSGGLTLEQADQMIENVGGRLYTIAIVVSERDRAIFIYRYYLF